jgi:hypothetical protein
MAIGAAPQAANAKKPCTRKKTAAQHASSFKA